jgi:hypothetical protein
LGLAERIGSVVVPAGLHARERERTPARVSSGRAHRGSPGRSRLDAGVGIGGGDEGDAVCFRTHARKGCHGAGDDDLVGNLRSKAPAMSSALGRSSQRRGDRSECRFRGDVNKQRRERERCYAATASSPIFLNSGDGDLA